MLKTKFQDKTKVNFKGFELILINFIVSYHLLNTNIVGYYLNKSQMYKMNY